MGCCGSGSKEPINNHEKDTPSGVSSSIRKNILIWGAVIILIGGFLLIVT